ncbi:MAG: ankyrin repeat domain-containing protein [Candidatus Omnitrophota bacterium]
MAEERDLPGVAPMMCACFDGDATRVLKLLCAGVDPNAQYDVGEVTALCMACIVGSREIVELLVSAGADVDLATVGNVTPLMLACLRGRADIVGLLLEAEASVNVREDDGDLTALFCAVLSGRPEVVRLLIDGGADANLPAMCGWTPLMAACAISPRMAVTIAERQYDAVDPLAVTDDGISAVHCAAWGDNVWAIRAIARSGADLDARTYDGRTPMHIAAERGRLGAMRVLAELGARAHLPNPHDWGRYPIHCAARHGRVGAVVVLAGMVDVDARDARGWTAIHCAAWHGHADVIDVLASRFGACVDTRVSAPDGSPFVTPLAAAACAGHISCVRTLLAVGAELGRSSSSVPSAFLVACQRDRVTIVAEFLSTARLGMTGEAARASLAPDASDATHEILLGLHVAAGAGALRTTALLLGYGCGADLGGVGGPLHAAARHDRVDVAKLLIAAGADVNRRCDSLGGATPLIVAASASAIGVLNLLLAARADVNATATRGHTALRMAVEANCAQAVTRLLAVRGVRVDGGRDAGGLTTLHAAAAMKNIDPRIVEALVAARSRATVPVDVTDNAGRTPLWHACSTGNPTAIDILLKRGASQHKSAHDGSTPYSIALRKCVAATGSLFEPREKAK